MTLPEPTIVLYIDADGSAVKRDVYMTEGVAAPRTLGNLSTRRYLLASEVYAWGHWRGSERPVRVCKYLEEVTSE